MKLTPINKKLASSMWKSMHLDVYRKTFNSISDEIYEKITDEIWNSNNESIEDIQIRTLNNLQNSSK